MDDIKRNVQKFGHFVYESFNFRIVLNKCLKFFFHEIEFLLRIEVLKRKYFFCCKFLVIYVLEQVLSSKKTKLKYLFLREHSRNDFEK